MTDINLLAAWGGILLGLFSGTIQGLLFHREDWLGGYGSWTRRMSRLGHISFFGIAFLNLAFVNTIRLLGSEYTLAFPSLLLIAGSVLMPTVCYLSAWRKPFRHLFFLPVLSLLIAAGLILKEGVLS